MTERVAYSPREVAKMLGIGRSTFWRWAREGKIEVVRIAGRAFVPTYVLTHLFERDGAAQGGPHWDRAKRVSARSSVKKRAVVGLNEPA